MLEILAFLASVALIIGGTLSRKIDVAASLAAGALLYGAMTLGPRALEATISSFNYSMFEVLSSLILAMALGYLMRMRREAIASGLIAVGPRFAAFAIPAAIGLLPMPGGAYISAVVADPLYNKMGLGGAQRSFLNYWMRHIWIPIWPLFQGVLITAAVLNVPVLRVISWSWPASVAALVAGVAVGAREVRRAEAEGRLKDLVSLWPLLAVAALSLIAPIYIAVAAALALFVAVHRPGGPAMAEAFRYALTPRIMAIIVFSLMFSEYIRASGLSELLASRLGAAAPLAAFLVPFLVGLATGVEFTFAALAFPPLAPLLHGYRLAVAFLGGFLGVMLSPAHSCFVLTTDYYKAEYRDVYRLLIRAMLAALAAGLPLFWALGALSPA
ncbi:DUF401 family protein [Thermoproteus tenax]|nr:DUF401 family protein [Thermoproteus tenax]